MGGANTKPERALATQQQGVMSGEVANAGQDRSQMFSILNPVIGFEQGLTSGDSSKVTEAAAPLLAQFTQQFAGAKQNLQDTAPRGAGRDFAASMLPVEQGNATAGALSNAVLGGFGNLTNIASGLGQYGLGELGAGLRAGEGASQSNQVIMDAQSKKHAATMGFLGDLVKSAGTAYAGFAQGGGGG